MRIARDSIDHFFDYDFHLETRTIVIGDKEQSERGVGPDMADRVIKALHLLVAAGPEKPIHIILNSGGGDWIAGMAIYDAIAACPCHVSITVCGSAMSMGSIILQAADERLIHPNSTVMVHDGGDCFEGHARNFEAWAGFSKKIRIRMYEIYAERSGKDPKYWEKRCVVDNIMTADEAVEEGLADKVIGKKEEETKNE